MRRQTLHLIAATILAIAAPSLWALAQPKIGRIDYIEGGVSISRAGKTITDPNIDDSLQSGDLIKTAGDGMLVIAFDKNTGMNGTLTVRAKTSLYLKVEMVKGEPKTSIDLLTGSLGSKVAKIAGTPTMSVQTSGAVMGVRGTEYEVAVSVNDSILVTCVEGQVSCDDGKEELPVPAGKVVEKRSGERLRYLPVAISSIKEFRQKWMTDEVEAFRADAPKALADFEKRYTKFADQFSKDFGPFQKSAVLKKWLDEDRAGTKINPRDPATLRDKKEMAGHLMKLRKTLFVFERIYYRIDELQGIIAGTPLEKREIRPGLTAGDFLRRVAAERDKLARNTALFRYAESLYAARNPDGEFFGTGDDDFFGTDEDF
jgi:hypothetical protein